jgi:hypothetical protein
MKPSRIIISWSKRVSVHLASTKYGLPDVPFYYQHHLDCLDGVALVFSFSNRDWIEIASPYSSFLVWSLMWRPVLLPSYYSEMLLSVYSP